MVGATVIDGRPEGGSPTGAAGFLAPLSESAQAADTTAEPIGAAVADTTGKCPTPVRLYREREGGTVQRLVLPCRRRVCSFCGPRYWRPRVLAGLHAGLGCAAPEEYLAVLLTAPGDADWAWNEGASTRWHRFVTYLRRAYPGARLDYWRVGELQERGAVHFHFLLRGLRLLRFCRTKATIGEDGVSRWVGPCCEDKGCLRRIALAAGFGGWVGVRRPRDYPGGVRSAGYYFGKYLLKGYSRTVGLTKLVTWSQGWRVDWEQRVREARSGWLFAGPCGAPWNWLGYEQTPPARNREGHSTGPPPRWWRHSWQWSRAQEARPIRAIWHYATQGGAVSSRRSLGAHTR